jgi:hypothetical protein
MKLVIAMILAASVAGCLTSADYGAENGKTVSQNGMNIVAEAVHQLRRCWDVPVGTGIPPVVVRFTLNRDGTLAREPVVRPVNLGDLQNAKFHLAAKSAMRAVRSCTPLRLPADRYEIWKEAEITFDTGMAPR